MKQSAEVVKQKLLEANRMIEQDGMSVNDACNKVAVHPSAWYHYRKRGFFKNPNKEQKDIRRPRNLLTQMAHKAKEEVERGMSINAACKKYKLSMGVYRRRFPESAKQVAMTPQYKGSHSLVNQPVDTPTVSRELLEYEIERLKKQLTLQQETNLGLMKLLSLQTQI